jgi:hypothetical protein
VTEKVVSDNNPTLRNLWTTARAMQLATQITNSFPTEQQKEKEEKRTYCSRSNLDKSTTSSCYRYKRPHKDSRRRTRYSGTIHHLSPSIRHTKNRSTAQQHHCYMASNHPLSLVHGSDNSINWHQRRQSGKRSR